MVIQGVAIDGKKAAAHIVLESRYGEKLSELYINDDVTASPQNGWRRVAEGLPWYFQLILTRGLVFVYETYRNLPEAEILVLDESE